MIEWLHAFLSRLIFAVNLENPGSLGALFALGILSDIGIPFFFLLETFLFFAAYRVGPLSGHVLIIIVMLLVGRECGAAVLYWLSCIVGNPFVTWLGKRFPRLGRDLERFRTRLSKGTVIAVAVVRLTPGLLQVPSLTAGVLRLSYLRFAAGVAISSLIYDIAFILFGFLTRIGLRNLEREIRGHFVIAIIITIIVAIIAVTVWRHCRRTGG